MSQTIFSSAAQNSRTAMDNVSIDPLNEVVAAALIGTGALPRTGTLQPRPAPGQTIL